MYLCVIVRITVTILCTFIIVFTTIAIGIPILILLVADKALSATLGFVSITSSTFSGFLSLRD